MRGPRRSLAVAAVASLAALAAAAPAGQAASASLATRLAAALAAPGVDPSRTGALVVDLRSGRTVFAHNAVLPLVPASNEKLPVALAVLAALGPSFRMRTEVLGEGRLVDRTVWKGNLVLKGFGDPTLSSTGLAFLARQVRALGIRRLTGSVIGDESWFDRRRAAPGWKPAFLVRESPPLGALVADRGLVSGAPVPDAALAAATLFRDKLRRAGVRVRGPVKVAKAGGFPLASVFSAPLAEILGALGVQSDNFTAELLLKQLGATLAGSGTTAAGAFVARRILADRRVPLAGVRLADGSGLSSLDRLTPRTIVAVLEAAWRDRELRRFFVETLAWAGHTGTLEHRLRRPPALGNVRAKTGTTELASALAGYARDRYAFAVLQNGSPVATDAARSAQDRVATVLAAA